MIVKETAKMTVLSVRRQLTIPQIKAASAEITPLIELEMAATGMVAAGPWIFISQNLPKESKTRFEIRFCRPITGGEHYRGEFDLGELEPIMVASATHQGSMRTLFTQGYTPLLRDIENSRHMFSGESREIYHGWAGQGAPYQEIEIQFGLAY